MASKRRTSMQDAGKRWARRRSAALAANKEGDLPRRPLKNTTLIWKNWLRRGK